MSTSSPTPEVTCLGPGVCASTVSETPGAVDAHALRKTLRIRIKPITMKAFLEELPRRLEIIFGIFEPGFGNDLSTMMNS